MGITRRSALALGGAGIISVSAFPLGSAFAMTTEAQAFIDEFTGGADVVEGGVTLTAPELAENGGSVPISVLADGAKSILIIAEGNPAPKIITFNFGELSGKSEASTRIRLAKSQDLMAIAKMADGSFKSGIFSIEVTVGGCG